MTEMNPDCEKLINLPSIEYDEKLLLIEALLCLDYGWKQHTKYNGLGDCAICFDRLKDKYVLETHCEHKYCIECILYSISIFRVFKCPTCNDFYLRNDVRDRLKTFRKKTIIDKEHKPAQEA